MKFPEAQLETATEKGTNRKSVSKRHPSYKELNPQ
jgi:hypothetical protein